MVPSKILGSSHHNKFDNISLDISASLGLVQEPGKVGPPSLLCVEHEIVNSGGCLLEDLNPSHAQGLSDLGHVQDPGMLVLSLSCVTCNVQVGLMSIYH